MMKLLVLLALLCSACEPSESIKQCGYACTSSKRAMLSYSPEGGCVCTSPCTEVK